MATQTSKLKLTKPAYTDTADIQVVNVNMDIVDGEFVKVDSELVKLNNNKANTKHTHAMADITGLELSSMKVNRPNGKTVEASIVDNETLLSAHANDIRITDGIAKDSWAKASANSTDIANLKTKVDNGQNFKLTNDNGTGFDITNGDANTLVGHGKSFYGNKISNAPDQDWWVIENFVTPNHEHGHQIATAWTSDRRMIRHKRVTWQPWRSL